MKKPTEFTLQEKVRVWDRINAGKGSPEDHQLAMIWADTHYQQSIEESPAYENWIREHANDLGQCWADNSFDPLRSSHNRNLVYLFAVCTGLADIENGGFHQFFANDTGSMAPEIIIGLSLMKLDAASRVLEEAMKTFGQSYPRESSRRNAALLENEVSYNELSQKFFESYSESLFRENATRLFTSSSLKLDR
jgi:hypothetical protein